MVSKGSMNPVLFFFTWKIKRSELNLRRCEDNDILKFKGQELFKVGNFRDKNVNTTQTHWTLG